VLSQPVQLILASASPRRKALMEQIGLSFKTHASSVYEPPYTGRLPAEYAMELAQLKASVIADQYPSALIVGSDTIVIVDEQVLGKPVDANAAFEMLTLLSGRTHQVVTAYSLQLKDRAIVQNHFMTTQVHFRHLDFDEINKYIGSGDPFDKAGAYGIQDYSGVFVDKIEGCFYNVVGFPLSDFNIKLKYLLAEYNLTLKH